LIKRDYGVIFAFSDLFKKRFEVKSNLLFIEYTHTFGNDYGWNKDNAFALLTLGERLFCPLAYFRAVGKMPEKGMRISNEFHVNGC